MLLDKTFTIVDVETTGGSPFFNHVIEIGLLRVEKGEIVEEFQTLINPGRPIPEFITAMTGISDEMVANAPSFAEIAEQILEKFEGAIFVAHNSQFDYGFLKEEFRRAGLAFSLPQLCTVRLSRTLYKEHKRHNLTEIIERFGFKCENRHRAFDDARVLWDFLMHCHGNLEAGEVVKAIKQTIRGPRALKAAALEWSPQPQSTSLPFSSNVVEEIVYETDAGETFTL